MYHLCYIRKHRNWLDPKTDYCGFVNINLHTSEVSGELTAITLTVKKRRNEPHVCHTVYIVYNYQHFSGYLCFTDSKKYLIKHNFKEYNSIVDELVVMQVSCSQYIFRPILRIAPSFCMIHNCSRIQGMTFCTWFERQYVQK